MEDNHVRRKVAICDPRRDLGSWFSDASALNLQSLACGTICVSIKATN